VEVQMTKLMGLCALAITLTAAPGLRAQAANSAGRSINPAAGTARLAHEVRHELVMLPYYGVFDNLEYQVNDSTVTLLGEVTRPTLKSDAENVVKGIEGVHAVVNHIKVLPLSPMDDRTRLAEYRAIYSEPSLQRYALQAVPPIHIIVDNGKVTLVGAVADQADKNLAGIRANSVPGVFSVTNDLKVEKR
jgi:hyperosmotically inducible protein